MTGGVKEGGGPRGPSIQLVRGGGGGGGGGVRGGGIIQAECHSTTTHPTPCRLPHEEPRLPEPVVDPRFNFPSIERERILHDGGDEEERRDRRKIGERI